MIKYIEKMGSKPFLNEDVIKRHYFSNQLQNDHDLQSMVIQKANEMITDKLSHTPISSLLGRMFGYDDMARRVLNAGFYDGIQMGTDLVDLTKMFRKGEIDEHRQKIKHISAISFALPLILFTFIGFITAIFLAGTTTISLAMAIPMGIISGATAGAAIGHGFYCKTYTIYERFYMSSAAYAAMTVVSDGIKNLNIHSKPIDLPNPNPQINMFKDADTSQSANIKFKYSPFLSESANKRRFIYNQILNDAQTITKFIKKGREITENKLSNSIFSTTIYKALGHDEKAKHIMLEGYHDGIFLHTFPAGLYKFIDPQSRTGQRNKIKSISSTNFVLTATPISTTGIAAGVILAATGIASLAVGIMVGLTGLLAGILAGNDIYRRTYTPCEELYRFALRQGVAEVKSEVALHEKTEIAQKKHIEKEFHHNQTVPAYSTIWQEKVNNEKPSIAVKQTLNPA